MNEDRAISELVGALLLVVVLVLLAAIILSTLVSQYPGDVLPDPRIEIYNETYSHAGINTIHISSLGGDPLLTGEYVIKVHRKDGGYSEIPLGEISTTTGSDKNISTGNVLWFDDVDSTNFITTVDVIYKDPGSGSETLMYRKNLLEYLGRFVPGPPPLGCAVNPVISANPGLSGPAPLTIIFTDASTSTGGSINSLAWNFGEGTESTDRGPHTIPYTSPGSYPVTLTVGNDCGETKLGSVMVDAYSCDSTVTADFTTFPDPPQQVGGTSFQVKFTDASTFVGSTIEDYKWDFGEGTLRNTKGPHTITYGPGDHTATLTVTDSCGKSNSHPVTVSLESDTACSISPQISAAPGLSGPAPFTIEFADASTSTGGSINSLAWNFGEGTESTDRGPHTITYPTGSYLVILKLKNDCGAETTTFAEVEVLSCTPPVASFNPANPTSGNAPLSVKFTDTSTGDYELIEWDFDDGATASGSPVTHVYEIPGTYSAKMTISGDCGSDFDSETIQVNGGPGFTVYGWLRFTQPPSPPKSGEHFATLVVDGNTDSNRRYHLQHNNQNTQFEMFFRTVNGVNRWVQSPASFGPVEGVSYLLVGAYNQSDGIGRLYVNGIQAASQTYDKSGIAPSPGFYQVGGPDGIYYPGANQRRLQGDVGGVGTIDNVLLGPEIQSMYVEGPPW